MVRAVVFMRCASENGLQGNVDSTVGAPRREQRDFAQDVANSPSNAAAASCECRLVAFARSGLRARVMWGS